MFSAILALSILFQAALPVVEPKDDLVITESCAIKPGEYRIEDKGEPGILRIEGENIAVVLADVTIDGAPAGAAPDAFAGTGIVIRGRSNVLWGGKVRGLKVGILVDGGEDHWVMSVDTSGNYASRLLSTPEAEDGADWLWPHENDQGEWAAKYGAGIWVRGVKGARVLTCWGHDSQNGILLDRASGAVVRNCNFSFNSGWGLALWRTTDSEIVGNRFDFCVRGYSHGVYARGQDSAGVLVFEQSHRNVFRGNTATHSGDGFFLYAGHETTRRTGKGGCNDNLVEGNDFSHAVANGIEATFSSGNRFIDNRLEDCNYGIWAGYSRDSVFERNVIRGCTYAGVAIEHGSGNAIRGNLIEDCARGIDLWWDEDKDLLDSVYGRGNRTDSADTLIEGNVIRRGQVGVRLLDSARIRLAGNYVEGAKQGPLALEGECPDVLSEPAEAAPALSVRKFDDEPWVRRGRRHILMTEWGPYDYRRMQIVPARVEGVRTARFRLLGVAPGTRVDIAKVTGEVEAALVPEGTESLALVVSPREGAGGYLPFEFTLKAGDAEASGGGVLLNAFWHVRHWVYTTDPRENPEAWQALLATDPVAEKTREPGIDYRWGSGGPEGDLSPDGFATLAETEVALPAGEYEFRLVSDDGVRLLVDGEVKFEDWTHHSPKDDRVRVRLPEGKHRLRLEHFELDGWAVLTLRLRRLGD